MYYFLAERVVYQEKLGLRGVLDTMPRWATQKRVRRDTSVLRPAHAVAPRYDHALELSCCIGDDLGLLSFAKVVTNSMNEHEKVE